VAWLTAWRMICTRAQIKPWETVLIFGIGGSVSLAALQILHAMGIRTIVTSRDETKLEKAAALGADEIVTTGDDDFVRRIMVLTGGRGVDVVFENVGKAVWPLAMKALVRGGRIVTCGATSGDDPSADLRRLFIRQLQVIGSTLGNRSEFSDLLAFVGQNNLQPHIDSEFPIDNLHHALDRLESGQQFGKIGIRIGAT
jgi:NADPH:quinone reductase-like Zn-dependent oxidoreductase